MSAHKEYKSIGRMNSVIGRARGLKLSGLIQEAGIPQKCGLFLALLLEEDGYSQDELASRAYVDKATVARSLRLLEEQGFISRCEAEGNRRKKLVWLTEKARSVAARMWREVKKVDADLTNGLSEAESRTLEKLLAKVEKNARNLHKRCS